jgi:glycine hydroxymethyltransferase
MVVGFIDKERVFDIVNRQNKWRREQCINLIASESVMSPLAEHVFLSDFEGRYNEHSGPDCHYEGTELSYEIEEVCNELFRKNFITRFADVRPISGAVANLIVYTALTKPGDLIVSLGIPNGAHISHTRWGPAGVRGLKNVDMSFDVENMNIDVERTVDIIKKADPKLVMLGGSMFLFPEPIREIREQISPKIKIIYDSAHVFGLVYNGVFQQPFEEGADIITSSTHKTFQGPQGGVIIGNYKLPNEDWTSIENAVFPGTLSNTHIFRFPALAITALEMNRFGRAYAEQVVRNAKAFGQALFERGFKALCPHLDFTESHQVIVDVREHGGGQYVARQMSKCNVICNKMSLPDDSPHDATHNPSGVRLGVQELTRWGMRQPDMDTVAELYKRVIIDREPLEKVKEDAIALKQKFNKVMYCFNPAKALNELEKFD